MPFLIISVILVAGIVWWAWGRDRAKSTTAQHLDGLASKFARKCKWTPVANKTANLQEYRCQHCGVTAYTSHGKPPVECKKTLRGSL